jgi:hypothetical protein
MGLLKTAAKVAVASSVHGRVQRRQQQRWAAQDAARAGFVPAAAQPPVPAPAPATPPAAAAAPAAQDLDVKLAQLTSLGQLRDAGVLTEDEFAAKKAQIIGTG